MAKKYEKAYRQGEILFFKVKKRPYRYGKVVDNGVIREGEKEGHEHKVEGEQTTLTMADDQNTGTLEIKKAAVITHPEHADLELPAGDYEIVIQKEATDKHSHESVKD